MDAPEFYACHLCPRQCGVNRMRGETGFCGETAQVRVASIEAHFGEEPPISGSRGSGTVFFSGCTLQCVFCQNYQISAQHLGTLSSVAEIVRQLEQLAREQGIHNVNFVTPDHFFPQTRAIVTELRRRAIALPAVYNMSGYQRVESVQELEESADIYLPDFKYADNSLGEHFSHCPDYSLRALDALSEMIRQKGLLDSFLQDRPDAIARKGVLVRHLILPGHVQNSLDALTTLFLEFGKDLPLSLMSQYHPLPGCPVPELQRRISADEFRQVYEHALELGLHHLFVQYPEGQDSAFLPDFTKTRPFRGNTAG